MEGSEGKSKIEPSTTTKTTKTTKKGKRKKYRQTDEEYMASYLENWKRENDYSIELEARALIYEAEKKKHDIQEFRNRCESLDYLFSPSEGRLIDYYLRSKYLNKEIDYCPIDEVDVNASHLPTLIEHFLRTPRKVGYCFTRCSLNEIHSATNTQGLWTFGEKKMSLIRVKKLVLNKYLSIVKTITVLDLRSSNTNSILLQLTKRPGSFVSCWVARVV